MKYPITETGTTTDTYFAQTVSDPYRWLEDDASPATEQWVKAQNKVIFDLLSNISFRDDIRDCITSGLDYQKKF